MAEFLYDLPVSFYQQACVTDGKFDAEKAAALGYSEAQFIVIKDALGLQVEQPDKEAQQKPKDHA